MMTHIFTITLETLNVKNRFFRPVHAHRTVTS